MSKLTKERWLEEGLVILKEFAQNKIRILYLCERLQVTRGSFYHHFRSIDDYVEELLKKWERDNTIELIRLANQSSSVEEQMQTLGKLATSKNKTTEVAIRSWSHYHPIVKVYLEKIDKIRLSYLEDIFEKMGMPKELAQKRAQLDYALLVGIQHLFPTMDSEQIQTLYQFLV